MIRRPPRSTLLTHSFPTRRSSDLLARLAQQLLDHVVVGLRAVPGFLQAPAVDDVADERSEEHTSELQSLMRISYAVFCLKKKKTRKTQCKPQESTMKQTTNNSKTHHEITYTDATTYTEADT